MGGYSVREFGEEFAWTILDAEAEPDFERRNVGRSRRRRLDEKIPDRSQKTRERHTSISLTGRVHKNLTGDRLSR